MQAPAYWRAGQQRASREVRLIRLEEARPSVHGRSQTPPAKGSFCGLNSTRIIHVCARTAVHHGGDAIACRRSCPQALPWLARGGIDLKSFSPSRRGLFHVEQLLAERRGRLYRVVSQRTGMAASYCRLKEIVLADWQRLLAQITPGDLDIADRRSGGAACARQTPRSGFAGDGMPQAHEI
jgi:hypothetical protein